MSILLRCTSACGGSVCSGSQSSLRSTVRILLLVTYQHCLHVHLCHLVQGHDGIVERTFRTLIGTLFNNCRIFTKRSISSRVHQIYAQLICTVLLLFGTGLHGNIIGAGIVPGKSPFASFLCHAGTAVSDLRELLGFTQITVQRSRIITKLLFFYNIFLRFLIKSDFIIIDTIYGHEIIQFLPEAVTVCLCFHIISRISFLFRDHARQQRITYRRHILIQRNTGRYGLCSRRLIRRSSLRSLGTCLFCPCCLRSLGTRLFCSCRLRCLGACLFCSCRFRCLGSLRFQRLCRNN